MHLILEMRVQDELVRRDISVQHFDVSAFGTPFDVATGWSMGPNNHFHRYSFDQKFFAVFRGPGATCVPPQSPVMHAYLRLVMMISRVHAYATAGTNLGRRRGLCGKRVGGSWAGRSSAGVTPCT